MLNIPNKVPGDTHFSYEFNSYVDELENACTDVNQVLNGSDSHQVGKSMAAYAGSGNYFIDSGIINQLNLVSSQYNLQTPAQYYDGMVVRCLPAFTNSGASTMNVAGLGSKNIKLSDGVTDVPAGAIVSGVMTSFYYNLALDLIIFIGSQSYGSEVFPGIVLDYAGFSAPVGYLSTNGDAVSRSSYAVLMAAITQTQTGTTTNTMTSVTGLSSTAQMYVGMPVESSNFSAGTTVASIVDGTSITVSPAAIATGSVSMQFFNWGNGNGSTTFNVPDIRRSVTIGQGGTASTDPLGIGNIVGQVGGEEAHTQTIDELVPHTHTVRTAIENNSSAGSSEPNPESTTNSGSTGGGQAFNIIQPSVVMYKIIKT